METEIMKEELIAYKRIEETKAYWDAQKLFTETAAQDISDIKELKRIRTDLRKEFQEMEEIKKKIKDSALKPYFAFEKEYQRCIKDNFQAADENLLLQIERRTSIIITTCTDELKEYFRELCQAKGVEWLEFEQTGLEIRLAAAQKKEHTKEKKYLQEFVERVCTDIQTIRMMDAYRTEIYVLYKRTLDLNDSIRRIHEWHEALEGEAVTFEDNTKCIQEELEPKPEDVFLDAPTPLAAEPESAEIYQCTFNITGTIGQIKGLKAYIEKEGISYGGQ